MSKGNTIVIEEQETPWNKKALQEFMACCQLTEMILHNTSHTVDRVHSRSEFYSDTGTRSIIVECNSAKCALDMTPIIRSDLINCFKLKQIPCTAVIHIKLENLI